MCGAAARLRARSTKVPSVARRHHGSGKGGESGGRTPKSYQRAADAITAEGADADAAAAAGARGG